MVDFRYHLVSIIAVFLALAVGIVLGTTTLNGVVLDNLNGQVVGLRTDKQALRTQLRQTQDQMTAENAFVKSALPILVAGRLTGEGVAVLSAPGTPGSLRDGVVAAVRAAGATVTAQIQLAPQLLDPKEESALTALVTGLGIPGPATISGTGSAEAVATLASVLVSRSGDRSRPAPPTARVLAAFQHAGMLTMNGSASDGNLALVLSGPASSPNSGITNPSAATLLLLATALDSGGDGAVIGGPLAGTTSDGALAAARNSAEVRSKVSTVDSVDSAMGQVETVLALASQLRGTTVAWGAGPGTTPPVLTPL